LKDIRYLFDENITYAVRDQLLRREPDMVVMCIGDQGAPTLGTPDEFILEWIEEHGYILVSRNRRTIPIHLQAHLDKGRHIPGILLLRRGVSIGQVIEELLMIWSASDMQEYRNQIKYVPF
jgi:hypothetical protein